MTCFSVYLDLKSSREIEVRQRLRKLPKSKRLKKTKRAVSNRSNRCNQLSRFNRVRLLPKEELLSTPPTNLPRPPVAHAPTDLRKEILQGVNGLSRPATPHPPHSPQLG